MLILRLRESSIIKTLSIILIICFLMINISSAKQYEFIREIKGIKSQEKPDNKMLVTTEGISLKKRKGNYEPILRYIIESGNKSGLNIEKLTSGKIIYIEKFKKKYKLPPGIEQTTLLKVFLRDKISVNSDKFNQIKISLKNLGCSVLKYYPKDNFIKIRAPISLVPQISLIEGVKDVRRVINFPLISVKRNYNVIDGKYYHVFLDVENHKPTDKMIKILNYYGVKIIKQYNDGITDFRAYVPIENLTKIAELPFVTHIEYHDVPVSLELYISKKMIDVNYIRSYINPNLNGSGVRVAVIDTGIDHHHPYLPKPAYEKDVRDNRFDDDYAEDEQGHGTHVIGIIAMNYSAPQGYEGVAPGVTLGVIKATGSPGPFGDVNQQIYDAIDHAINDFDAQVISMSLGILTSEGDFIINSDGTTKWEQKVDWAARNGAVFVKSAGNEGVKVDWKYPNPTIVEKHYNSITCPGTAKNVISVGAINHWFAKNEDVSIDNTIFSTKIDQVTMYSSRGDTGDIGHEGGRDKPEVVAPGGSWAWTDDINNDGYIENIADGVVSARGKADNQSTYLPDVDGDGVYKDEHLYRLTGTSMAAPHVSGLAALIIDAYDFEKSSMTSAIVKAMILGGAIDIGDNDLIPNHVDNHIDDDIGYGKIDAFQSIYSTPTRLAWYFGGKLENSGDYINYTFNIPNNNITYKYIRVIVTWNDPEASSTDPDYGALKNDIDIFLYDPNNDPKAYSITWQQNIEQILFYDPDGLDPGTWTVKVKAQSHWDSPQDFGGYVAVYSEKANVSVKTNNNNLTVYIGEPITITATVENSGGESASGVTAELVMLSPASSIEDYFVFNHDFRKTLLGNIPPLGSRTLSWILVPKNNIINQSTIKIGINITYSNLGATHNCTIFIHFIKGPIYVPDDYAKIQWAINNATAGDTIIVRDGIYNENIVVDVPNLTIESENGSANCIVLAANPYDSVFKVTANCVSIRGFTIKGANGSRMDGLSGIRLENVYNCVISDNDVSNNLDGIYLFYSSDNIISNNDVSNNDVTGITLWMSSNNSVLNNSVCKNGYAGIFLFMSSYNALVNNNASLNYNRGIELQYSPYNTLSNNVANSNYYAGVVVSGDKREDYRNSIDTSNKVNGKPIYYFYGIRDQVISELDTSHLTVAASTNVTIKDNIICGGSGLQLAFVNNSIVSNNKISNNRWGIILRNSLNNTLVSNILQSNSNDGIYLYFSSNNMIVNNMILNGFYGIRLFNSANNIIKNNNISNCYRGIELSSSSNNKVYLNNFISNSENAYSDSTNIWNSTEPLTYMYNSKVYTNYLGNYWSDYTGSDINGDGIGDAPYNNLDYYPLIKPKENYIILTQSPPIPELLTIVLVGLGLITIAVKSKKYLK